VSSRTPVVVIALLAACSASPDPGFYPTVLTSGNAVEADEPIEVRDTPLPKAMDGSYAYRERCSVDGQVTEYVHTMTIEGRAARLVSELPDGARTLDLMIAPAPRPPRGGGMRGHVFFRLADRPTGGDEAAPVWSGFLDESTLVPFADDDDTNGYGWLYGACHAASAFTFIDLAAERAQDWIDGSLGDIRFRFPAAVFRVTRTATRVSLAYGEPVEGPQGGDAQFRIDIGVEEGTPFDGVKRQLAGGYWKTFFPDGTEASYRTGDYVHRLATPALEGYEIFGGMCGHNFQDLWAARGRARIVHVRVETIGSDDVAVGSYLQEAIADRVIDSLEL
jgi:hypothetical protein